MDHRVEFAPTGISVRVPSGTTLAEAVRKAGLPVASACRDAGLCARCGLEIIEGGEGVACESAEESAAKQRNRIGSQLRLACQVELTCDLVVTAPYWSSETAARRKRQRQRRVMRETRAPGRSEES